MSRLQKSTHLILLSVFTVSLTSACSSTEPFGPSIPISFAVQQPAAIPSTLRVEVGTSRVDLRADATSRGASASVHVLGYGDKPVHVTLLGSQSDTLATVSWSRSLEAGNEYGIAGMVSRVRPMGTCVGVISAIPLRNSPSDTLFVMDFAIPKGAVC